VCKVTKTKGEVNDSITLKKCKKKGCLFRQPQFNIYL
jgi:hypothetical protein